MRKRYHTASAAWLAGFFVLGFVAWRLMAGHLIVLLYLAAGVVAYLVAAFRARCPDCRWPALLKPITCLGMELYRWTILMPRACRHCGRLL